MVEVVLGSEPNSCGECNACCNLLEIGYVPDVGFKPSRHWCEHCVIGEGCGIYKRRPPACRQFQCLWLRLSRDRAPLEARPDLSGVMITKPNNTSFYVCHLDPEKPDAWKEGEVGKLINRMARQGSVFLLWTGKPGPTQVVKCVDGEVAMVPSEVTKPDHVGAVNIRWRK